MRLRIKKLLKRVSQVLLIISILPLLVVFLGIGFLMYGILAAAMFPAEYPRYRRSNFRHDFNVRYQPFITRWDEYKFYEYMSRNKTDFEFIREDNGNMYLKKDGCVYLFDWFEFIEFEANGVCMISDTGSDHMEPLADAIKERLYIMEYIPDNAEIRVLLNRSTLDDVQIPQAEGEPLLCMYDRVDDIIN